MRLLATTIVLGALAPACAEKAGVKEASRPAFELRAVVAPEIASLVAEIGPEAAAPVPDAETAERVRGLADGYSGADVRMKKIFADEMKEIGEMGLPVLDGLLTETSATDAQRLAAIQLAGEIDTPRAAEWLVLRVESAKEPWIRANAAWQLSRSSQDQVVPRLLLRLKYELDGETVIWMATALAHFRNWAGLDGLGVLASTGATEEIRASATERIGTLAREAGVEDAATLWKIWAGTEAEGRLGRAEPSPRHRLEVWRCIERLARQDLRSVDDARFVLARCAGWAVGPLTEALHEETTYIRTHAAQCLERMGHRAASAGPTLVLALADPRLAPNAAAALGSIGWPPAAEPLVKCLDSGVDPEVRNAAAQALGVLSDPAAVEPLREIVSAEEPIDLRQTAAQSLVSLGRGDEVAAFLVECLGSQRADASAAEAHLETWLASRAAGGDEEARAALESWKALAPAPGTMPAPAETAARQRDRLRILESSPLIRQPG